LAHDPTTGKVDARQEVEFRKGVVKKISSELF
jgi:hypothetical protein